MDMEAVFDLVHASAFDTPTTRRLLEAKRNVGMVPGAAWCRAVCHRDSVTLLNVRTVINRAFWKMREIAMVLPGTSPSRVYLLAEAPGGFAQAVKHMWPSAHCVATSLTTDGAISFSDRVRHMVTTGLPSNGDLCAVGVINALVERLGAHTGDLVTADGGETVHDLDLAEQQSTPLAIAQVAAALRLQAKGGSAVVKIFEGSTRPVRDLLRLVRSVYTDASIFKPRTSKTANSERYIICRALTDPKKADAIAAFLQAALSRVVDGGEYVHRLVGNADDAVDAAFDAMANTQACSIEDMCYAARHYDFAALLRQQHADAAWLRDMLGVKNKRK
jgi:23S rRNA U2552 (ribose-2'-O)-methylase RlmE/FtsJ